MNENENSYQFWKNILLVLAGGFPVLLLAIINGFWINPYQTKINYEMEIKKQEYEYSLSKAEEKIKRLYQPLLITVSFGRLDMSSEFVFYEVQRIMKEWGYLADKEVMENYEKLLPFFKYRGYNTPSIFDEDKEMRLAIVREMVRQNMSIVDVHHSDREEFSKIQKDFYSSIKKFYKNAKSEWESQIAK